MGQTVSTSNLSGNVTLGDIVLSINTFSDAGNFSSFTPNAGTADLEPFRGMLVRTKETDNGTDVFQKVTVAGFTAEQPVPIRMNIQGVFADPGSLPPSKVMRTGFNLVAPHILGPTSFEVVFRGALIPNELAVSAITFRRQVVASVEDGEILALIREGFETSTTGDALEPQLDYWVFIVEGTPTITP